MGALFNASSREVTNVVGRTLPFLDEADKRAVANAVMAPDMMNTTRPYGPYFVLRDGCVYRVCNGDYLCVSTNGERRAPYIH